MGGIGSMLLRMVAQYDVCFSLFAVGRTQKCAPSSCIMQAVRITLRWQFLLLIVSIPTVSHGLSRVGEHFPVTVQYLGARVPRMVERLRQSGRRQRTCHKLNERCSDQHSSALVSLS